MDSSPNQLAVTADVIGPNPNSAHRTSQAIHRLLSRSFHAIGLPAVLIILVAHLRDCREPSWLGSNSDPDYYYLVDALSVAELHLPRYFDHPGIPLTCLEASIFRITHIMCGDGDLAQDVLGDPEFYLQVVNHTLLVLTVCLLIASGAVAFRATGKMSSVWLMQLAPFLTGEGLLALTRSSPETLLMIVSLGMALLVLLYIMHGEARGRLFVVCFAVISCIAVGTKLSALPLIVLPVLILSWRQKCEYAGFFIIALAAVACFVYFWQPMLFGRVTTRATTLVMNTLWTGEGWLDSYIDDLWHLAKAEPLLFVFPAINLLALLFRLVVLRGLSSQHCIARTYERSLLGITLVEVLQILLVAKYQEERYLVPAVGLLGLDLLILVELMSVITRGQVRRSYERIFVVLLTAGVTVHGQKLLALPGRMRDSVAYQQAICAEVDKRPNCTIAYCYGASSPAYALWFGNGIVDQRFSHILQELYPNMYFLYDGAFFDHAAEVDLEHIVKRKNCVLLQGWHPLDVGGSEELLARVELEQVYPKTPGRFGHEFLYKVSLRKTP